MSIFSGATTNHIFVFFVQYCCFRGIFKDNVTDGISGYRARTWVTIGAPRSSDSPPVTMQYVYSLLLNIKGKTLVRH